MKRRCRSVRSISSQDVHQTIHLFQWLALGCSSSCCLQIYALRQFGCTAFCWKIAMRRWQHEKDLRWDECFRFTGVMYKQNSSQWFGLVSISYCKFASLFMWMQWTSWIHLTELAISDLYLMVWLGCHMIDPLCWWMARNYWVAPSFSLCCSSLAGNFYRPCRTYPGMLAFLFSLAQILMSSVRLGRCYELLDCFNALTGRRVLHSDFILFNGHKLDVKSASWGVEMLVHLIVAKVLAFLKMASCYYGSCPFQVRI